MAKATVCPLGVKGSQAVQMFDVMDSSPQRVKKWFHNHCSLLWRHL